MPLSIDVFFILSSFLLTLLGVNEYKKNGNFSFKNYFIRRALRIWPLYFLIMFFSFVVLKLVKAYTGQQITLPPAGWYLFFISNFYLSSHVFFLRLLWTLSVEEQFYLIWGLCLLLFQKHLSWVISLLSLISILFIFVATANKIGIYFNTLTYIIDMMAGAYAAFCITQNNALVNYIKHLNKNKIYWYYISMPVLFVLYYFTDNAATELFKEFLPEIFRLFFIAYVSLVIIEQMVNVSSGLNLSKNKLLIYTGKISYGLYCIHGMVISFGIMALKKMSFKLPGLIEAFILLLITFALASISYVVIEKPFLKLKGRF